MSNEGHQEASNEGKDLGAISMLQYCAALVASLVWASSLLGAGSAISQRVNLLLVS